MVAPGIKRGVPCTAAPLESLKDDANNSESTSSSPKYQPLRPGERYRRLEHDGLNGQPGRILAGSDDVRLAILAYHKGMDAREKALRESRRALDAQRPERGNHVHRFKRTGGIK